MEPDKFEKYIKSKLEERRITPSDGAWERISGQLENSTEQRKNGYFWMGIAASFILLLGASLFFFTQSEEIEGITPNTVVDVEQPKIIEQNTDSNDSTVFENTPPEAFVVTKNEETKGNQDRNLEPTSQGQQGSAQEMDMLVSNTPKAPLADEIIPTVPVEILDAKIAEVIAQVNVMELHGNITDAEVDSLLMYAQKEILRQKLLENNTTVNAMALLTEVEEELDQSFRDQLFETLKAGFLKVRTAVADRND